MMYGTMARMLKTTVYLPPSLKARLERVAATQGESEADVIRAAVDIYTADRQPRPRLPLAHGRGVTDVAEHVDDVLGEGFGRR